MGYHRNNVVKLFKKCNDHVIFESNIVLVN